LSSDKQSGDNSGMLATDAEEEREQAKYSKGDAADDVPHGVLGELAGEGVADLIRDGMRSVHSEDEEDNAEDEHDTAEYCLRVHDWLRSEKVPNKISGLFAQQFCEDEDDKCPAETATEQQIDD
jgi:hypothetical protein